MSGTRPPRARSTAALVLLVLALAPSVAAHAGELGGAVETRLRVPAWLLWGAGGLVVAASFAVVGGYLSRREAVRYGAPDPRHAALAPPTRPGLTPLRALGLLLLALAVLPALVRGSTSLLPQTLLWIVVVGLLPLLAYTVGDVWRAVSPFEALRGFTDTLRGGRDPAPYPARLGAWPAVAALLALVTLEVAPVAWPQRATPAALVILGYTLLTLLGMARYGADAWLREAEVVTRSMRWWRAASPIAWTDRRPTWRGFGAPLSELPVHRASDVAFTLAVLYSVNFDAFIATHAGAAAHFVLDGAGFGALGATALLAVAGLLVFLGIWHWATTRLRDAAASLQPRAALAARFAAVLLPIAVAYHLAHHLFTLVEGAPRLLRALLDPLGLAAWGAMLPLPDRFIWPSGLLPALAAAQVLFILAGHVVAVIVAHRLAFHAFPSRVQAVKGEVPLTAVMVVYTTLGLWLLSEGGAA